MIDKDGIKRPDKPDVHMRKIKHDKRKISFDKDYNFKSRNVLFRLWSPFFVMLVKPILAMFFKSKYKVTYADKKKAKSLKKKAFVMTINHVFVFDDLIVGANLFFSRRIFFTGLDRNFKRRFVGFWLRTLGGIPIPSSNLSGMKKFNEDIAEILKSGKPVLYNPEGSMWPYFREVRPFKRGAFSMAVKSDVPVLPLALTFKRRKKRNGKFKYRIFITVCDPIYRDKAIDEKTASDKLMKEAQAVTTQVVKQFYESQDCGFDD